MRKRKLVSMLMVLAVLFVFAGAVPSAHAVLQRVGPVSNAPSVGNYPAWYQDTTGIALEFCDPKNAAEVAGGWCLLLPADVPNPPEEFPLEFADEHFWFAADASITPPGNPGLRALLVLATEAAFAGAVEPGGQIAFNRIRVRLDPVPMTGLYRFIHPYGEELIEGTVGDRIFFSDDVGLSPGDFAALLTSRLGPFLLPSLTPGGAEIAAVPGPVAGKLYIADPGRLGPVTGSSLPNFIDSTGASRNHNIFRIEGPVGSNLGGAGVDSIETTDFALMGRLFTGAIASKVTVDRASYARSATANKVDVYATGLPTQPPRLPASPPPAAVAPVLSYFDAPCTPTLDAAGNPGPPFSAPVGFTANPMATSDSHFFGQSHPATLPLEVCVQANATDAAGVPTLTFIPAPLGDQVFITEALFDPTTQILSVKATSSDEVIPQTLTVAGLGEIDAVTGQLVVVPLAAPPDKVTVHSSALGSNSFQVCTGGCGGGVRPVALNDTATTPEDTATTIAVLANDINVAGGTVILASSPVLGTAVANPDGSITYTPNLNANGTDSFTYRVNVGGQVSNAATVTVTITPANDPPVANNDSFPATVNIATTLNVLANDTDPDAGDTLALFSVSAVTPAGATVSLVGTTAVRFTATATGIYTFTYRAQDAAGAVSNIATVTVTVTGPANNPPVANADSFTAAVNTATTLNVLANDTDPNAGDVLTVANLSGVTPAGATATVAPDGKSVSFTATVIGTYTFTYQARDAAGALSNTATVTVTAASAVTEALLFLKAEYVTIGGKYRVEGVISPARGQTITLEVLSGAAVVRTDILPSAPDGRWSINLSGVILPDGPLTVRATSSNGTVRTATLIRK
ncbi:MAG: tandem-95 repeat protein [Candidatus Methylomirabilis oxyfera]|nr:tandem-95 repeat protein [Candidatus Methylomirabilis oxyfera]